MILNCVLVNDSSAALIDLTTPLSVFKGALREIQPFNLGGLIENSASTNSSGNSFEMAFEVSVGMPLVIHDVTSSEIFNETERG